MSDRKIKAYCVSPYVHNIEELVRWLRIEDLPFTKNMVWDPENPDYVVVGSEIYTSFNLAETFHTLVFKKKDSLPIRIFYGSEALAPDFTVFDYAVTWDWGLSYLDRYIKLLPNIRLLGSKQNELSYSDALMLLRTKKRFCNFMYRNGRANPDRDKLFYAVSEYKRVESLGKHINNVNTLLNWRGGGGG